MILANSSVYQVHVIGDLPLFRIPVVQMISLIQEHFRNRSLNQLVWSFVDQNRFVNGLEVDSHRLARIDGLFAHANFRVQKVDVFPVTDDVVEGYFFDQLRLQLSSDFINDRAKEEEICVPDRIVVQAKLFNAFSSQKNVEHNQLNPHERNDVRFLQVLFRTHFQRGL
jgi:hypothetical protein